MVAVARGSTSGLSRHGRELLEVSPILLDLCAAERISIGALFYGLLPSSYMPLAGDGFPWLETGSPAHLSSIRHAFYARRSDGWERDHYDDGAFIRTRTHPQGRWAVRIVRAAIETSFRDQAAEFRSTTGSCAVVFEATLPESMVVGIVGMPVGRVIQHPLLAGRDTYLITAVRRLKDGRTHVRFRCPPVSFVPEMLPPLNGDEIVQLGRNPELTGEAAIRDMIVREATYLHIPRHPHFDEEIATRVAERVAALNEMSPPWGTRLPTPDLDLVDDALTSMARENS
jgi:hypothetical protein